MSDNCYGSYKAAECCQKCSLLNNCMTKSMATPPSQKPFETPMSRLVNNRDLRPRKGGWAPGTYINQCGECGEQFAGAKRAVICAACAYNRKEKQ